MRPHPSETGDPEVASLRPPPHLATARSRSFWAGGSSAAPAKTLQKRGRQGSGASPGRARSGWIKKARTMVGAGWEGGGETLGGAQLWMGGEAAPPQKQQQGFRQGGLQGTPPPLWAPPDAGRVWGGHPAGSGAAQLQQRPSRWP